MRPANPDCGPAASNGIASEITLPARTRPAASRILAGVMKLSVPSSSSAPQRPQLRCFAASARTVSMSYGFFIVPCAALLFGVTDQTNGVVAALLVILELDQPLGLHVLEQLAERTETVVGLVEPRIHALDRLLDDRAPHRIVV